MTGKWITRPQLEYSNFYGLITVAPEMRDFFSLLKRVARTDSSVLVRGETGTGKELVAHALHRLSRRQAQPFAAINCATLNSELLASELFGHVRGAFTGAVRDKKGLFQMADGGSLFLDEIGELPMDIQARLLRVLQDRTITPVGSVESYRVDVRWISATHRSLRRMVQGGRFREDLMYRIRVVPLFLPKLTEREGDIEALTWHFIEEYNKGGVRFIDKIEERAMEAISEYAWPGNIRELKNNIEYAFAMGEGDVLRLNDLTPELQGIGHTAPEAPEITAADLEKNRIIKALNEANGKKGAAAERLGMSRSTLWRKLREHRLIRMALTHLLLPLATVLTTSAAHATKLDPSAQVAAPFETLTVIDAREIAGRAVARDEKGKLLPWPLPEDPGYSYSSHLMNQWSVLWDQHQRHRFHYYYCCFEFSRDTFDLIPDTSWANSTGYLRAMMQGFVERFYAYTGDPRTLTFLRDLIDYELENGRTPADYAWARVPYASANPGAAQYRGWSALGSDDTIEPHVVGEDGYAYARFYQMTGDMKYLEAAIFAADSLVKNYRKGDEHRSPWPLRCDARSGRSDGPGMGDYGANMLGPVLLFDELIRLHVGATEDYRRIRNAAWDWLHEYPMKNNVWVGYFEDVIPSFENRNQVLPLEYARYALMHPHRDPKWKMHAEQLIHWVETTPLWPKYLVHGALVTTEQGNGQIYCCNAPNECCDSHTARLAAVKALYFLRTGDRRYKEQAFRSLNWVTYFQGLPAKAAAPFGGQWWFTDEYADGPRRIMDILGAIPEWAPSDESHLLASTSVVNHIRYATTSLDYSTFDRRATETLRLNFSPLRVLAAGRPLTRRTNISDSTGDGYSFHPKTGVLRIRHSSAHRIQVLGANSAGADSPPLAHEREIWSRFDHPHPKHDALLSGLDDSQVIDWTGGDWKAQRPHERMVSFSVTTSHPLTTRATVNFAKPLRLHSLEVYNPGNEPVELWLSNGDPEDGQRFVLAPDSLRRLTLRESRDGTTRALNLQSPRLGSLLFDNFRSLVASAHR